MQNAGARALNRCSAIRRRMGTPCGVPYGAENLLCECVGLHSPLALDLVVSHIDLAVLFKQNEQSRGFLRGHADRRTNFGGEVLAVGNGFEDSRLDLLIGDLRLGGRSAPLLVACIELGDFLFRHSNDFLCDFSIDDCVKELSFYHSRPTFPHLSQWVHHI